MGCRCHDMGRCVMYSVHPIGVGSEKAMVLWELAEWIKGQAASDGSRRGRRTGGESKQQKGAILQSDGHTIGPSLRRGDWSPIWRRRRGKTTELENWVLSVLVRRLCIISVVYVEDLIDVRLRKSNPTNGGCEWCKRLIHSSYCKDGNELR